MSEEAYLSWPSGKDRDLVRMPFGSRRGSIGSRTWNHGHSHWLIFQHDGFRRGSNDLLLGWRRRSLDVVREPGETLQKTLTGCRTAGYDVPDLVLELSKL